MRIRNARPDDAFAIAAVHQDSWREAYDGILPAAYLRDLRTERLGPRWRQRLSRPTTGHRIQVAQIGDTVTGFVKSEPCTRDESLDGFAGEITMLYVHPRFFGGGIGRDLFDAACDHLAAQPLYWLVVWVVEVNHPARRFYDRMGLVPDGARRVDEFPGAPVSVLRYVGPLNSILDSVQVGQ